MSSVVSNVDLVRQILSGPPPDAKGMSAFAAQWLDPAITLEYPGKAPIPFAGKWRGYRGVADFMSSFHQEVETLSMDVTGIEGVGEDVFVRGVTHARARRTGRSYVSAWLLVWTVKEQRIARMTEYHDTQAIAGAFA